MIRIFTDAAVDGNPGPAGIGVVAVSDGGQIVAKRTAFLVRATNNVAEYVALLEALKLAEELKASAAEILTDSQLVTRQLSGRYQVRDPELKVFFLQAQEQIRKLPHISVKEISRAQNRQANSLARAALRWKGHPPPASTAAVKVSASLLAAPLLNLVQLIRELEAAGVDWIHIDVMDGHFVPNITFGIPLVEQIRSVTSLPLDVHLMVEEPAPLLKSFAQAGADILTIHCEATRNLHRDLETIREAGARPGVAINPGTPAEWVRPVFPIADLVLVMSVDPGRAGQTFLPYVLPKVRLIRSWVSQLDREGELEVDGGINEGTAPKVVAAGATVLVSASGIFQSGGSIKEATDRLRQAIRSAMTTSFADDQKGET